MRSRHEAVLNWRDGSNAGDTSNGGSVSGNGDAKEGDPSTETKDGTPSLTQKVVDQTQNG